MLETAKTFVAHVVEYVAAHAVVTWVAPCLLGSGLTCLAGIWYAMKGWLQ